MAKKRRSRAAGHGVAKSRARLSNFTFTFHFHALEKEMATHSRVLAWRIPGRGSLVGCRLWGRTESDTTEQLHFHFSLACIGEGNGNPLQCSCLENPRDGGAWWAAVYGVAQSRTWLKRLSSQQQQDMNILQLVLLKKPGPNYWNNQYKQQC